MDIQTACGKSCRSDHFAFLTKVANVTATLSCYALIFTNLTASLTRRAANTKAFLQFGLSSNDWENLSYIVLLIAFLSKIPILTDTNWSRLRIKAVGEVDTIFACDLLNVKIWELSLPPLLHFLKRYHFHLLWKPGTFPMLVRPLTVPPPFRNGPREIQVCNGRSIVHLNKYKR